MRNYRVTGPVEVPERTLAAMTTRMVSHRSAGFRDLFGSIAPRLGMLFGTNGTVLPLTCSGTGSLEAVAASVLRPGDRVLSVQLGYFGERFAEIAAHHGAGVDVLAAPWGLLPDTERIAERVAAGYDAVLLTHNETSTGVVAPLREWARAIRSVNDCLILVDVVSSLAATEIGFDELGLDAAVGVTQKALACPPGLARRRLRAGAGPGGRTGRGFLLPEPRPRRRTRPAGHDDLYAGPFGALRPGHRPRRYREGGRRGGVGAPRPHGTAMPGGSARPRADRRSRGGTQLSHGDRRAAAAGRRGAGARDTGRGARRVGVLRTRPVEGRGAAHRTHGAGRARRRRRVRRRHRYRPAVDEERRAGSGLPSARRPRRQDARNRPGDWRRTATSGSVSSCCSRRRSWFVTSTNSTVPWGDTAWRTAVQKESNLSSGTLGRRHLMAAGAVVVLGGDHRSVDQRLRLGVRHRRTDSGHRHRPGGP
jgi:hypothetical protein